MMQVKEMMLCRKENIDAGLMAGGKGVVGVGNSGDL